MHKDYYWKLEGAWNIGLKNARAIIVNSQQENLTDSDKCTVIDNFMQTDGYALIHDQEERIWNELHSPPPLPPKFYGIKPPAKMGNSLCFRLGYPYL